MAIQAHMYSGFLPGGSQDLLMENACVLNNLCLIPQQQKPQDRFPFLPKEIDDHPHSIISSHFQNQRIEIDLLIHSQNEKLRIALQEQRRQQTSLLMKKYESKIESVMKQKDEEIARASNRNRELQNHVRRMEMERQTWETVAREKEAMVGSLNSTIQRLREAVPNAEAEDAESWCVEEEERERRRGCCRCCNSRKACVIMLPCRHLSSCKSCEAFLDSCPLCNVLKKATIEALL